LKKVFISYSLRPCGDRCAVEVQCSLDLTGHRECVLAAEQKRCLDQLVNCLTATPGKFDVLWDRNVLYASSNWKEKLYPCLGECHAAVIFLSEGALGSSYVPLESMVLMWRKILQPNLLLIPVYFGKVDENRLKDPKSVFYGIGLEGIQGIKHKGDDSAAIAAIRTLLDSIADPGPLTSIAILHKLAALLADAAEEAVKIAAEALGMVLNEWGAAKALQLALSILRRGLGQSLNALNKLNLESQRRLQIVQLLAPAWVDAKAAAEVMRCGLLNESKPVLVINGNRVQTVQHYVSKAWAHEWEPNWPIVKPVPMSDGMGAGALKEAVLRAFWLQFMDTSGESWSEEAATDALNVIKERGKDSQPVYVLLERADGLDLEEVAQLQSELREVSILYLAKQQPPQLDGFLEMKPKLTLEAENSAFIKYQQAYGVLVTKNP
jgi:hypothetical protein